MSDLPASGRDSGYLLLHPDVVQRTVELKTGLIVEASHYTGLTVSENLDSPLGHATTFSQGTILRDAEGGSQGSVRLVEFVGPQGDVAFAVRCSVGGGDHAYRFVQGLGRWAGISGTLQAVGRYRDRADQDSMYRWEAQWQVDPTRARTIYPAPENVTYAHHDKGYSFHGPHIVYRTNTLKTGITLVASTQEGLLVSENPNGPRHDALGYSRGTTIVDAEGQTLGDVMLLENTDPDGDLIWFYHEWWYAEGPGGYRILGGTGKWAGITGVARILGHKLRRADDHYMVDWEMDWNV